MKSRVDASYTAELERRFCGAAIAAELDRLEKAMNSEPTDKELVAAIRATRGQHGVAEWATTWDMLEHLSKYPPRVVLTCLGKLIETGAIGGCVCGLDDEKGCYCRGDFEVIGDFETDSRPKVWVDE